MGRVLLCLFLMLLALVCGYMFLAGFEYPGVTAHKVVTGTLSVVFLVGAVVVARRRTKMNLSGRMPDGDP